MKVWTFIDWYEASRLRLFKNKRDVYRYTEDLYFELYNENIKISDKNIKEISDYVGLTIKQMKVE